MSLEKPESAQEHGQLALRSILVKGDHGEEEERFDQPDAIQIKSLLPQILLEDLADRRVVRRGLAAEDVAALLILFDLEPVRHDEVVVAEDAVGQLGEVVVDVSVDVVPTESTAGIDEFDESVLGVVEDVAQAHVAVDDLELVGGEGGAAIQGGF